MINESTLEVVRCRSFPFDPDNCTKINIARRVLGAFSFISCLFVICIIWLFHRYAAVSQRLVLFLSIAALFNALGRLFQDSINEKGSWCRFQAFWLSLFNFAVLLWICSIAVNLYINVIRNVVTTKNVERWYHGVCWGGSLAVAVFPFTAQVYGPSGSWCWITDTGWQMATWYVPLVLALVGLTLVYGYIIFTFYRRATNWAGTHNPDVVREQESLKAEIKHLRLYPVVFVLLSLFPLINRIQNAVSNEHVFALVLLHSMTASVQGAVYALIFTLDRDTLRSLTPRNIKAAWQKKWAPAVVVQEYNMAAVCAPPEVESRPEVESKPEMESKQEVES